MNTYHARSFCFILACLISPDVRELCFLLAALVDRPGGVCYNNRCLDTRLRTHGHDKQLPHQHGVSCGCVYSQVLSCTHSETVLRQEFLFILRGRNCGVSSKFFFFFCVCLFVFPSVFLRFHSSLIVSPSFSLPERFSVEYFYFLFRPQP